VTSTGLHGANRLASNSLLESLVYGAHAGAGASRAAAAMQDDFHALPLDNPQIADPTTPLDLSDIRNSLRSLMWHAAGVQRIRDQLEEAAATIRTWRKYVLARQFPDAKGWELQNMLTVAQVIVHAALVREESRGVHMRTDFPTADDRLRGRRFAFRRTDSGSLECFQTAPPHGTRVDPGALAP
jgi:L-aspartate oxidase